MVSLARIDPSRTKVLREKFEREFLRRLNKLKRMINDLVITEDAFGLVPIYQATSRLAFDTNDLVGNITQNSRWRFRSDSEKLQLFGVWLSQQVTKEVLEETQLDAVEDSYWYPYIWEGYQKGVGRIFTDVNKLSSLTEDISDVFIGSKKEFLRQSFSHPVSVERVKQIAGRVLTDLKGVTDTMEAQIKKELIDGLTQGLSPKEVARRLNDRVEKIGKTRARTIAQTETIRAHAEGQLDGLERYGLDEIGVMSEWTTSGLGLSKKGNPSPCELCAPLDGVVLKVSEARGLIPRHPNCITGDSVVIADDVKSLMKTHYTGEIFKITTSDGCVLSTTKNHMLLTQCGFVPAKLIYEGIKVLKATSFNFDTIATPDDKARVSTISDVFAAFSESSFMTSCCMPLAAEDIHGDGESCNKEINIVRPNGELRNNLMNAFPIESSFIRFQGLNKECSLPGFSSLSQFLHTSAFTFDSSMGIFRDALAFFLGSILHANNAGFRTVSLIDTRIFESLRNNTPTAIEMFCNVLNAHPILKHLTDSLSRYISTITASSTLVLPEFEIDSRTFQSLSDAILTYSESLTYVPCGESRYIEFDDVIGVDVMHVTDLPVYDLETESSVYRVNGLITSNCKCTFKPANVGEPLIGRDKRFYDPKAKKVITRKQRQLRTKAQIEKALKQSKSAKKGSQWAGDNVKISKKRPPSPVG